MLPYRKSNMDSFLEHTSPRVPVQFHTQRNGSSSSSSVASGEEVRIPRIVLRDVWKACDEWSCYGVGVPLSTENLLETVNFDQYYAPTLSAIQIFTIKPFPDDADSSSRSTVTAGTDGAETSAVKPNPFSNYRHRFLTPDKLGYLYFQYNETEKPWEREPLTAKMKELAKQYSGLSSLTSSDLSPYSWISITWFPAYSIPPVKREELLASFLTYHSLTPFFPETFPARVNEIGETLPPQVVLPPFGAVTLNAFGNVWIRPRTSDSQMIELREKAASSFVETMDFTHNDLNFYMSSKFYGRPR
ncbi:hypothetical protein AALP_AA3G212700 [Arabis alpina]|uniref:Uncharacterized protein n=1 Tax=Arabis alpina TaxID=50452 RepID=A0A087HAP9_ARAAL|nr:hypothetical protein AALP_AA3G212700 [Arabis alpina]